MKCFQQVLLAGVLNGQVLGYSFCLVLSCVTVSSNIFLTKASTHIHEKCSFRHIFLYLMILWTILTHDVVNHAGSDSPRFELSVIVVIFYNDFLKVSNYLDSWFELLLQVGMIAINDGIVLRNHIPRILKKHFREKPYYVDLLDLFNEVI